MQIRMAVSGMSRLDELIAKLCPDGVEYKTIGEIAVDISRHRN